MTNVTNRPSRHRSTPMPKAGARGVTSCGRLPPGFLWSLLDGSSPVREFELSNVIPRERKLLFTPEILQDPYPAYARLHAEGPLHYLEVGANGAAAWSIFSHAECSAIAKDPRLSAKRAHKLILPLPFERQPKFKELAHLFSLWMIFMDAPEHTRLRKLLNKGFAPGVIEALRPQVEAIVDRMLGSLRRGPRLNSSASSPILCRCASFSSCLEYPRN